MAVMFNTVTLKGSPIRKEGVASAPIVPGQLVEFGGDNDLRPHSTAGGNARKAFAVEWTPDKEINDPYQTGEQVMYVVAASGDEVYALLDAGQSVTKGDPLESAGNGNLRKHTPPSEGPVNVAAIVGFALETVDNTGGSQPVRIRVEVA